MRTLIMTSCSSTDTVSGPCNPRICEPRWANAVYISLGVRDPFDKIDDATPRLPFLMLTNVLASASHRG
jgi:hypothetical protein